MTAQKERTAVHESNPYAAQLRHFHAVINGKEEPVCSGRDAMQAAGCRRFWPSARRPNRAT